VTADKNPLEEAVDQALSTFVYAPIGLLFDGPARFPKLVRNGRNQVTNARMMGQFAVQMGRTEVEKRTSGLDGPVVDLLRGLGVIDGPPPGPSPSTGPAVPVAPDKPDQPAGKQGSSKTPAPEKPATKRAGAKKAGASRRSAAKKTGAKKATPKNAAPAPSAAALPITDYDSLSASQVVNRLQGLSTGELEAIRGYEAATRARKTILNRVQQLLKS
jgi:hypothetical protein